MLDLQTVQLGAMIALLDKYYPSGNIEEQVLKGIRRAKKILEMIDVAALGGDKAVIDDIAARVLVQSDWAVRDRTDKVFVGFAVNQPFTGSGWFTYMVPTGKTLYIASLSMSSRAHLVADADKNQMCHGLIQHGAINYGMLGGNGGGGINFIPAIAFEGPTLITGWVYNDANHNTTILLSVEGYEL